VNQGGTKPRPTGRASPATASEPTSPPAARGHRLQPRQPASPAGLALRHPELVADESAAAAVQDRRAPHPTCAGTSSCSWRRAIDVDSFRQIVGRIERLAWHPRDREDRGTEGGKSGALLAEYLWAEWSPRTNLRKMSRQLLGRRGNGPCDAFRRRKGSYPPSETRGNENLSPNPKSRIRHSGYWIAPCRDAAPPVVGFSRSVLSRSWSQLRRRSERRRVRSRSHCTTVCQA